MSTQTQSHRVGFKVIDVMDVPHGGWILRLRLQSGESPSLKELRGSRMEMRSSGGDTLSVLVKSFAIFGGKPTDDRLTRSGRLDLRVEPAEAGLKAPSMVDRWELVGPLG